MCSNILIAHNVLGEQSLAPQTDSGLSIHRKILGAPPLPLPAAQPPGISALHSGKRELRTTNPSHPHRV